MTLTFFDHLLGRTRADFFIQEESRGIWHAESRDHCEIMLCGKFISVDANVRIQQRWGPKKCFGCYVEFKKRAAREAAER